MKIEVGKRYVLRNGVVTPPLESWGCRKRYPYFAVLDSGTGVSWTSDGSQFFDAESPLDIVAEYTEEDAPAAAAPENNADTTIAAAPESSTDATIAARAPVHGSYKRTAILAQLLKFAIADAHREGDVGRSLVQEESLHMICTKIARIVCGDPNHADHWHDIGGYARLVEQELNTSKT